MDPEKLKLVAEWVERGTRSMPHTYAKTQDLEEVTQHLVEWIESFRIKDPKWFAVAETLLHAPGPLYFELFCARWAACGFPIVALKEDLAHAFLRADVQAEHLEEIRPRWPAFLIDLPDGLLHMHGTTDTPPAHFLAVFHDPKVVAMCLRSTVIREIVGMRGEKLASHLRGVHKFGGALDETASLELMPAEGGSRDAMVAAWKLAIGVEMDLEEPHRFSATTIDAPTLKGRKAKGAVPRMLRVQLTRRVH